LSDSLLTIAEELNTITPSKVVLFYTADNDYEALTILSAALFTY